MLCLSEKEDSRDAQNVMQAFYRLKMFKILDIK